MKIIFTSKVKKSKIGFSAEEFVENYLFGIPLEVGKQKISESVIQFHLDNTVEKIENLLQIKLEKQIISEKKDFNYDDWIHWSYVKATYPVVCGLRMVGYLGNVKQTQFPANWIAVRKSSDEKIYSRNLYMVPTYGQQTNHNNSVVVFGLMPSLNWFAPYSSRGQIPLYWTLEYITGFDNIPKDILSVVYKLTAIQILMILNDAMVGSSGGNATGMGWGVTSKSISLDGLSQSVSSIASSTGMFGPRIKQYARDLWDDGKGNPGEINQLIDFYKGITWGSIA